MKNAIEIHDLCKTYPGFSLKNISFTVPEGLCCGFVGPNGAGKSTTLRMMAGLAFPDSGDIRLDACINDEQETIYSVEMLCCKDEELLKKARYFQCNIDSDIILSGKRCTKLKKSYIIFICTFDPFSDGRHIYTFENRCLEDLSLTLGDETTEIFLSTKGKKDDVDDEIKDFLAYIENSTDACAQQTSSQLVKAIHKRVTEIKLDKDMEPQYMNLSQMQGGI